MNFKRGRSGRLRHAAGFTLIELMITVAIVAILMAVALPSYREHVVRSNRAAVEGFMQEVANRQERYLLDNRSYADSLTSLGMSVSPEISPNYTVTVTNAGVGLVYTITATPIGSQLASDTQCGALTLNNLGTKTASGGGDRCWR